MPAPRIRPRGKTGGSSEAISEALNNAKEAMTGEGKIAETVLNKLNKNLKQESRQEAKQAEATARATSSYSSPSVDTSAQEKEQEAQQQRIEKEQERQQQEQEERAKITEEKRAKIEKLKEQRDAKIEAYRNGSKKPPLMGFFMSNISLYIMGLVDFGLGWIPVVGDIIAFFVSAIFWFIPCLILFDLMAYIRILLFLGLDMVIGMIPVFGNFADILPEFLLAKWGPPAQLKKAWEEKLPAILERIRQDYDHKIAVVEANSRDKLKKHLDRIRGHFSGLAADNQKIVLLLAFFGIIVVGPFGIGAVSDISFFSSLPVVAIIALVLLLITKLGMLTGKETFGLMLFLALNILWSFILSQNAAITQFLKDNTLIVMIFFFAFSILFVLRTMDVITNRTIVIIMLLLILGALSFRFIGYFSGDSFTADTEQAQVEKEAVWEEANIVEKIGLWITEQRLKGEGEYLPEGETEATYEFMGVIMEDPEPLKDIFYSTEPIQIDIDYQANSYEPISISTSCRTGTQLGIIEPDYPVQATASYFPRVSCIFDNLPLGSHKVDVKGVYNYRSTVRLPLKLITTDFERLLLAHQKDAGTALSLETFLEETSSLTSAGPIQFGVSNTKEMGEAKLKMPMAMDKNAIANNNLQRVHKLKFQLQQSYDQSGGIQKIERVTKAQFNMPKGIALSNCNFAPGIDLQPMTENGRWIYNIVDDFNSWQLFTTLECDVSVDAEHIDVFFPQGVEWSKSTMLLTVDYDYSIQKSVVVRVEA